MANIKVIAWDFDGVLTSNVVDGRFIWADDFEAAQREALESSKPIFVAFNTMALGNPQSPDL